jgi:hypothetical protein
MRQRPASFTDVQERYIIENASAHTAKELATSFGLTQAVVYGIGYRHHLEFKRMNRKVKESPPTRERRPVPVNLLPDPAPARLKRVNDGYSNSGYLQTVNKYL